MEQYKKTVLKMASESFRDMKKDLAGFISSRGLESFGAGISGVGTDSLTLAGKVLEFIYMENSKADYKAMMEGNDDED